MIDNNGLAINRNALTYTETVVVYSVVLSFLLLVLPCRVRVDLYQERNEMALKRFLDGVIFFAWNIGFFLMPSPVHCDALWQLHHLPVKLAATCGEWQ